MPKVEEGLDWQIYFKKEGCDNAVPFYWIDENDQVLKDSPVTLRTVYPKLKDIFESEKAKNKTKSEFKQGHRKKIFEQNQLEEIVKLHEQKVPNTKIAKKFNCDEKTIRNYLKKYNNDTGSKAIELN